MLDRTASYASVAGVDEARPIADGHGGARQASRITYGPLNALPAGSVIVVR